MREGVNYREVLLGQLSLELEGIEVAYSTCLVTKAAAFMQFRDNIALSRKFDHVFCWLLHDEQSFFSTKTENQNLTFPLLTRPENLRSRF